MQSITATINTAIATAAIRGAWRIQGLASHVQCLGETVEAWADAFASHRDLTENALGDITQNALRR